MPEDVNGLLETDVFQRLAPGRDRICSVLVAEGFDYPTVSAVMGISDFEIRHLLAEARKRLLEAPSGHHMSPPRVFDARTNQMHYVASPDNLGPKKALRIMPWTGCQPFSRESTVDWLGIARVIGNRYEHPSLFDEYPELLRKGMIEMENPQRELEQQLINAARLVHHQAAWFAADLLPCRVVGGLTRWG